MLWRSSGLLVVHWSRMYVLVTVGDNADGSSKCSSKFQRQTYAALTHETEMIVLAQIGTQIKGIQCISGCIIVARCKQPFVFAELSGSGKQTAVGSYIQSVFVIRLYGPDGVLLLTVQIQRNLTQAEMLEIERITVGVTVECAIGYESDDDASG